MNKTAAATLAAALPKYAAAFRILGVVAALGAITIGYEAGTVGLTQFERDMDQTWHLTETVMAWWLTAAILLLQAFGCAAISNSVALLLESD